MIIACPACTTRYVVPDTALGMEGRTVRCAKCRHSWFQDSAVPAQPEPTQDADASAAADGDQAPAPAEPATQAVSPAPAVADFGVDARGSTGWDDIPPIPPAPAGLETVKPARKERASRFEARPPFRPRRNTLRLWTWIAGIFAVLALGAMIAVYAWGLPGWVPLNRPTFAAAQSELKLNFPLDQQERRQLPNGTEYFGASGTITNTGSVVRQVPSILIVLRDERERIVYSWEVVPPRRSLAPGETIAINEAVTDVPRSARIAEIGWKPD